ncbi:MAG: RsmB/NOP family class I SAM-dependent RNA methyltransferase [Desulfurococcales archaeon]|nr:RsmB/NOP family class I SAM-dependent RNA methyltransferase [Desulfurococcales archaeon]
MVEYEDVRNIREYLRSRIHSSINGWIKETAAKFGYRDYMIARYLEILGSRSEVIELLNAFEKSLKPSIRCNTLKVSDCRILHDRLSSLGYLLKPIEWEPTSFIIEKIGSPPPGATHEFLLGMYYLYRGSASLIPPLILRPDLHDIVLDMAAAPGGKTTHLAQIMRNEGLIVAVDVSKARMRALRSNLERLGVRNVLALRVDGVKIPEIFGEYFNKVLLDAPCTAEGLIQVDKSRKTRTSLSDLLTAREKQVKLLLAALDSVKSGGVVLYTTCSIAPEENELVISEVLSHRNSVGVEKITKPVNFEEGITEYFGIKLFGEVRFCGRLYPHVHGMEGFFLCLLRKY